MRVKSENWHEEIVEHVGRMNVLSKGAASAGRPIRTLAPDGSVAVGS